MFVSYNWIKEYVDFDENEVSPEELANKLTLCGLEVVDVKAINPRIEGLRVGEVLERIQHPNADRLSLTKIKYLEADSEVVVPVVCGAANIAVGQKIILATVGTQLAPDFVIKQAKIRGKESVGMVCSKSELGLEESSEGIWVLPNHTSLTHDPQSLIGHPDFIYEIDVTSNRPDCLSVLGVVREVAAILSKPYSLKNELTINPGQQRFKVEVLDDVLCPRYLTAKISQITVKPSPDWVKTRLLNHGIRPINNIVDVTNLMMLEYGQPLHAFDSNKIKDKIIVRPAQEGESFTTLDRKELTLTTDDLVIADQERAVALAGVMGGVNSGIEDQTTEIILEAAVFQPNSVRNTRRRHRLTTDAAYYFERFVDREMTPYVLNQAIKLIVGMGGGTVSSSVSDSNPTLEEKTPVILKLRNVKRTLGIHLSKEEVAELLKRLKFKLKFSNEESLEVIIPRFRNDIQHEWDLIEEIARLYGYDRIPEDLPKITNSNWDLENQVYESLKKNLRETQKNSDNATEKGQAENSQSRKNSSTALKKSTLIKRTRSLFLGMGYHEVITYPFFENQWVNKIYGQEETHVRPDNPVWVDISLLRSQLLFGNLRSIKSNHDKGNLEGNLNFTRTFEVGRVFYHDPNQQSYQEEEHLALFSWGAYPATWMDEPSANLEESYYRLKGDVENLFSHLGYPRVKFEPMQNMEGESGKNSLLKNSLLLPSASAVIKVNQSVVGTIGQVSLQVLELFDLNCKVFYAEIDLERLQSQKPQKIRYQKPSAFPRVSRDLAIVIDDTIAEKNRLYQVIDYIKKSSKLVNRVILSSIYAGSNLPPGKCSVVFSIVLRASDRTLERTEADQEITNLVDKLKKKFKFDLR